MASLAKVDGRFYLDFYDARRTPKRKRVRIQARTRRDADVVRAEIERAYALGQYDPWRSPQWPPVDTIGVPGLNPSTSFSEARAAFLRTKQGLRKATQDHYRWVLDSFAESVKCDPEVGSIDQTHLSRWLGRASLSDDSVRTYWKTAKVFFRWLEGQGISIRTEGFAVSRPSEKLSSKMVTPEQLSLLTTAARASVSPYMESVIILTFELALRLGEVCALRWDWVDLDQGEVRVQSAGGFKTKSGGTVVKPVTDECRKVLSRLRCVSASGRVVVNNNGNPLNPKYTSKRFKKLVRAVGLPETITFHGLRHGALSLAAANGATMEAVRQFAGHASMAMTQRYVHLGQARFSEDIRAAMRR